MEQLDEVRRGRRRAIVDASIATVTIGGTLCALHWLTRSDGRDEEATNKTPVYIPLKVGRRDNLIFAKKVYIVTSAQFAGE